MFGPLRGARHVVASAPWQLHLGEPGDPTAREPLEQALGLDGVEMAAPEPVGPGGLRTDGDAYPRDRSDRRAEVVGIGGPTETLRYPVDHFDVYAGPWHVRLLADQVDFIARSLGRHDQNVPVTAETPRSGPLR